MCPKRLAEHARAMAEADARELEARLLRNGVPEVFLRRIASATPLFETEALCRVRAWARLLPGFFGLLGPVGCGKSLALAWLMLRRRAGIWVTAGGLARGGFYSPTAPLLQRTSFLVLDELGAEPLDRDGRFIALLDDLVNARTAHGLPTAITSNLDARALDERYGGGEGQVGRIWDRMRAEGEIFELGYQPNLRGLVRP